MRIQVAGETEPDEIQVAGGAPATVIEVDTTIVTPGATGVSSVNGQTGDVTLTATDVNAAPTTRQITAGTGLTGGGTLAADRTLTVAYGTTSGTAAQGNDSRLSDARTPTAHATSHASAGSDPVALDQAQITGLAAALAALLPLTGGTLTGALTGTTFTGSGTSQVANLRLGSTGSFGGATGGAMAITNVTTAPTGTPSGVVVYAESGLLKVRQSDGSTVVLSAATIAAALQASNNLSDVANKVTGLNNLGVLGKTCATNETNATTTQQASTQLVIPVLANATYTMMGKLAINSPSGVNFVHSFTGPSGATMIWGDSSSYLATIGTTDTWSGTGALKWANIFGTLTTSSTAGNLPATFASGTASNTATLAAGSQIVLQRTA